jgi:aldehyde dehydrogenase (NAD+)
MTSLSGFLHQIMRDYTPYQANDTALSPGSSTVLRKESAMRFIDKIYIDGSFVTPHGTELFDLYNPATAQVIGQVCLADEEDARTAIAAAKRAFPSFSRTSKAERIALLRRMHAAIKARREDLLEAIVEEYGAPLSRAGFMADHAANVLLDMARVLEEYRFTRRAGAAEVMMEPLGVAGLITPWNSDAAFICGKLAAALAAGCTAVIKPSEMSAIQTQVVTEALHAAGLPAGVFNVVTGRGDVVGTEITGHPDVAKISFTGSTAVGKAILRAGAETMKRITLELGGKSPTVILDDANLAQATPLALGAGFMNSGQACIAGTRILVPRSRLGEVEELAKAAVAEVKTGNPRDPETTVGPMVSQKQWDRVQRYIRIGIDEGTLLAGGEGRPDGLDGWFVRPTLFTNVRNDMTIAREEIFGPVLSIIPYADDEEAIAIANDTPYGLQAYVLSGDMARARRVADRIVAGRVLINTLAHEPMAPFGGFKQSGIGREYGDFGLEAFLEPKSLLGLHAA